MGVLEFWGVVGVAVIGSLITQTAAQPGGWYSSGQTTNEHSSWYDNLNRPSGTPSNTVFPVVWSILYLLIFLAINRFTRNQSMSEVSQEIQNLFWVQLILNLVWVVVFFGLRRFDWAIVVIILLDLVVLWLLVAYWRTPDGKLSFYLTLPYFLWLLYATYLTIAFTKENPSVK